MMKNRLLRVYLGLQYISCVLWVCTIPLFYWGFFMLMSFGGGCVYTFFEYVIFAFCVITIPALLLAVPTIAFFKSIKVTKRLVSGEKLNFKDKVLLFPWAFAVLYFGAVILLWLLCSGIVLIFNEIAHLLK